MACPVLFRTLLCQRAFSLSVRGFEDDLVFVDQAKLVFRDLFHILRCVLVLFQLLYLFCTGCLAVDLLLQFFLLGRIYLELFFQPLALHAQDDEQDQDDKTDAGYASVASLSFFPSFLFHSDPCFFLLTPTFLHVIFIVTQFHAFFNAFRQRKTVFFDAVQNTKVSQVITQGLTVR